MKNRQLAPLSPPAALAPLLAAAVLAGACGGHGNGFGAGREPVREETPREGTEAAQPAVGRASSIRADCAIPEGLLFTGEGLTLPAVVAGDEIEAEQARATVELARTGDVLVRFEIEIANRSAAAATALAGFAYRASDTGAPRPEPMAGVLLESPGAAARSCRAPGPAEMKQPFVDVAHWIEIDVPAGGRTTVSGMYKAAVTRADKPATLFGYRDRFADNWRNWDWPYTKAPEYQPVAERLRPFHGEIALIPAASTRVTLQCREREDWLRTMSHEQNVQKLRTPGAYEWTFADGDRPSRLGFEFLPDLPVEEEIEVFERLVAARKNDLRARIRLADLLRFGGDAARRAEVLAGLLQAWPANAKAQLLEGRNDVRAGACVGRVVSLRAAGKNAAAKKAAAEGVKLLAGFETTGEGERNGLALSWLSAVAEGAR